MIVIRFWSGSNWPLMVARILCDIVPRLADRSNETLAPTCIYVAHSLGLRPLIPKSMARHRSHFHTVSWTCSRNYHTISPCHYKRHPFTLDIKAIPGGISRLSILLKDTLTLIARGGGTNCQSSKQLTTALSTEPLQSPRY